MKAYDETIDTVTKADDCVFGQWLRLSDDIPHQTIEQIPVLAPKVASKKSSRPPAKKKKQMLDISDAP
ncbi:Nadh:flavin oxidoreductase nadh oxidase [Lasiodiplodia theobromae]|uniref:Nadh:flavin oxidoreductase nadh oxidase n=1 Tax=Lasiodiplodia theobromae TaxID=45133 RepID=UPI0015C36275|nr:Nadh:flavin oxidoreductase nadh oxidase [Lasiodiplodia theobromae]KAF4545736.1 Nadh:flavin oxidoreductase nadh oxidase [Lasiodiplodia theobromae]